MTKALLCDDAQITYLHDGRQHAPLMLRRHEVIPREHYVRWARDAAVELQ